MVRRVFNLVLCLLAVVPQGLCSCAATETASPPPSAPTAKVATHTCCRHASHTVLTAAGTRAKKSTAPVPATPNPRPVDHEPDCRAILGSPTGVPIVAVADGCPLLAIDAVAFAAVIPTTPRQSIDARDLGLPPTRLPLYLALNVLRI